VITCGCRARRCRAPPAPRRARDTGHRRRARQRTAPRRRQWAIDDIRAGLLLAVAERRRRGARRLPQQLPKDIAKDLDGVASWASVDRAARREGLRGGDLLDEAERAAAQTSTA
jgi:hypothetical protein